MAYAKRRRPSVSQPITRLWKSWVGAVMVILLVLYVVGSARKAWRSPEVDSEDNTRLRRSKRLGSLVQNGKVQLSDVISAALYLSEVSAHEIIEVKTAGKEAAHIKGKTDEGVDEPVTVADAQSNSVFVNGLRHLFPGIDILSEETDPAPLDLPISYIKSVRLEEDPWLDLKDVLVTVDPLDATKEFTENLLEYVTTMVCVVHKGRPIAGVINEVFQKGEGPVWGVVLDSGYKTLHGAKSQKSGNSDAVIISRSHTGSGADVVSQYLPGHHAVFAGGSGYKSLQVVESAAVGYVHVTKIKAWDVCAADAVVRSAGGDFTDLGGRSLQYYKESPVFSRGLVAALSKDKHRWLVDHLKDVQIGGRQLVHEAPQDSGGGHGVAVGAAEARGRS